MKKIILLLICGSLSGCIIFPVSHDHRISLAIEGSIVSEKGVAIEGARINLTASYSEEKIYETISSRAGSFKIGPITEKEERYIVWLGPASRLCSAIIEVEASGYKPFKKEYREFGPAGFGGCSKHPRKVNIELKKAI